MATTWQEGSKLTAKGLALQTKPLAGKQFAFTRAVMSSVYVQSDDQEALTDIPNHEQDLYLQPVTLNSNGTATLLIVLRNDDVTTSYTAHTIGIYALDPDEGEILYATMTDETGDVIPTFQEAPNSLIDWTTDIGCGNASTVIIQREPDSYVSFEVANQLIEDHNTSATAHNGVIAAIKSEMETHIANEEIHVTAADKASWNEITTHTRQINSLTSDLASLAFDFAMSNLNGSGGMLDVFADKIGSADDVVIISGQYADGKVYI